MNTREKVLAIAVGTMVVGWLLYMGLSAMLLSPARALDAQARSLREENAKLEVANSREGRYTGRLEELAGLTYGTSEFDTKERLSARLTKLVARSGLSTDNLSLDLQSGAQKKDAYHQVGGLVSATGTLDRVVDFLFLLGQQPFVHRLEGLSVTPHKDGQMRLRVKYATLILQTPKDKGSEPPATQPATQPAGDLDSPGRKQYEAIVTRDLFRPYIQRPPAPPVPARPVVARAGPAPPPPPPPPRVEIKGPLQVADLSSWEGQAEVLVLDTRARTSRRYKIGDTLAEGKIVRIDYRPMPMPRKPELTSPSRVILKFEKEYWAVELGQSLADRRRLKPEELPKDLRPTPASAPAASPPEGQAARAEGPAEAEG